MTEPSRKPTLADVARLARVSLGSASRALSVPAEVKQDTLERVTWAVERLGYIGNGAARALASRSTHTVAAIYPVLSNPIFVKSIHALQQELWNLGFQLLVGSHEYTPKKEAEVLRAVVGRGVDGVILMGSDHDQEVFDLLRMSGLPHVLSWAHDESDSPNRVGFSHYGAAVSMARLVLSKGHKAIGLCYGDSARNERARARLAGTRDALREAGVELRPEWTFQEEFTVEGGRHAVRQLARLGSFPTALICSLDSQAIGAIVESRALGINLPGDLSIVGADDTEWATVVQPALTSIHVPAEEVGIRTARRMVALIRGQDPKFEPPLETHLVVRESLGKPRRTRWLGTIRLDG